MEQWVHKRGVDGKGLIAVILIFFLLGGVSCSKKEASLKQGTLEFRKEVKEIFRRLAPLVLDPVLKGDEKAAEAALEKFVSKNLQKSRARPNGLGIVIKDGTVMVRWSRSGSYTSAENYSEYKAVRETLKNGRTTQQRLFLQSGEKVYMICSPILKEKNIEGVVGLGFHASEMKEQFGLSEEEFLALDFN